MHLYFVKRYSLLDIFTARPFWVVMQLFSMRGEAMRVANNLIRETLTVAKDSSLAWRCFLGACHIT